MLYTDYDVDLDTPYRNMRGAGLDEDESNLALSFLAPSLHEGRRKKLQAMAAGFGFGGGEGGEKPPYRGDGPLDQADESGAMNPALAGHLARRRASAFQPDEGGAYDAIMGEPPAKNYAAAMGFGGTAPQNAGAAIPGALPSTARPKTSAENAARYSRPGLLGDVITASVAGARGSFTNAQGQQVPVSGADDVYRQFGFNPQAGADDMGNQRTQALRGDLGAKNYLASLFNGDKLATAQYLDTGKAPWDLQREARERLDAEKAQAREDRLAAQQKPKRFADVVDELAMRAMQGDTQAAAQLERLQNDPLLRMFNPGRAPAAPTLLDLYKRGDPVAIQKATQLAKDNPGWARDVGIHTGDEADPKAQALAEKQRERDRADYAQYRALAYGQRIDPASVAADINAERESQGLAPLNFARGVNMQPGQEKDRQSAERAAAVEAAKADIRNGLAANYDQGYVEGEVLKKYNAQLAAKGLPPMTADDVQVSKPQFSGKAPGTAAALRAGGIEDFEREYKDATADALNLTDSLRERTKLALVFSGGARAFGGVGLQDAVDAVAERIITRNPDADPQAVKDAVRRKILKAR